MKKSNWFNNFIFGILLAGLLVCEGCVDEVSPSSFFRVQNRESGASFLIEVTEALSQQVWDEGEALLQVRDLRLLQYASKNNYRNCRRNILGLLVAVFSLCTFGLSYHFMERRHFICTFSHKFIMGYIHQTDGEKSSHLL